MYLCGAIFSLEGFAFDVGLRVVFPKNETPDWSCYHYSTTTIAPYKVVTVDSDSDSLLVELSIGSRLPLSDVDVFVRSQKKGSQRSLTNVPLDYLRAAVSATKTLEAQRRWIDREMGHVWPVYEYEDPYGLILI